MSVPRVLLVDDDEAILGVLRASIKVSLECEVLTTLSAEEGLSLMEQAPFDAVVSDICLDGMDGATFLIAVQKKYPTTMRMAFSARSDNRVGLQLAGAIHQFLLKPTDLLIIGKRIANLVKLKALLGEKGVDGVVSQLKSLPNLPAVYVEIEHAVSDPRQSVDFIGRILEKDIAMSAKILHLVNSSFFGLREHVTRPAQAAVLLGLNIVKSLVLAVHIFESWNRKTRTPFSLEELWNHSLRVGATARAIARLECLSPAVQEDIYVAGIFHDIGKLILEDNLPESYDAIQKLAAADHLPSVEAEFNLLGTSHAEIGAYLLALWGFSDTIVNACAHHHRPGRFDSPSFIPLAAIHVANALDHQTASPSAGPDMEYLAAQNLTDRLEVWRAAMTQLPVA